MYLNIANFSHFLTFAAKKYIEPHVRPIILRELFFVCLNYVKVYFVLKLPSPMLVSH